MPPRRKLKKSTRQLITQPMERKPPPVKSGDVKTRAVKPPEENTMSENKKRTSVNNEARRAAQDGSPSMSKNQFFGGMPRPVVGYPSVLPEYTKGQVLVSMAVPFNALKNIQFGVSDKSFEKDFDERKVGDSAVLATEDDMVRHDLETPRMEYAYYCQPKRGDQNDGNTPLRQRALERYHHQADATQDEIACRPAKKNRSWMPGTLQQGLDELESFLCDALTAVFPTMSKEKPADWIQYKKDDKDKNKAQIMDAYTAFETVDKEDGNKVNGRMSMVDAFNSASNSAEMGYKNLSGWLNRGDHCNFEMSMCLLKTVDGSEQTVHIDDVLARQRADILRAQGDLDHKSYQVGYLAIVPLMAEGACISVVLEVEGGGYKRYVFRIPFGACMFLRLDTYHNGTFGSTDSWRVLAPITTSKTPYVENSFWMPSEERQRITMAFDHNDFAQWNIGQEGAPILPTKNNGWPPMESYHFLPAHGIGNEIPCSLLVDYWKSTITSLADAKRILKFLGFDLLFQTKRFDEWWCLHNAGLIDKIHRNWRMTGQGGDRRIFRHTNVRGGQNHAGANEEGKVAKSKGLHKPVPLTFVQCQEKDFKIEKPPKTTRGKKKAKKAGDVVQIVDVLEDCQTGSFPFYPSIWNELKEPLIKPRKVTDQQALDMSLVINFIRDLLSYQNGEMKEDRMNESWIELKPIMERDDDEKYENCQAAHKDSYASREKGVSELRIANLKKDNLIRPPNDYHAPLYSPAVSDEKKPSSDANASAESEANAKDGATGDDDNKMHEV